MTTRPQIAALVSVLHKHAHAQHIVDRFPEGYGWNSRHHRPALDLVSVYVNQARRARTPSAGESCARACSFAIRRRTVRFDGV